MPRHHEQEPPSMNDDPYDKLTNEINKTIRVVQVMTVIAVIVLACAIARLVLALA